MKSLRPQRNNHVSLVLGSVEYQEIQPDSLSIDGDFRESSGTTSMKNFLSKFSQQPKRMNAIILTLLILSSIFILIPAPAVAEPTSDEGIYVRFSGLDYINYSYPEESYFVLTSTLDVWNNSSKTVKTSLRYGCGNHLDVTLESEISQNYEINPDYARLMGYCAHDTMSLLYDLDPYEQVEVHAYTAIMISSKLYQLPVNTYYFDSRYSSNITQFNYGASMEVLENQIINYYDGYYDNNTDWGTSPNEYQSSAENVELNVFSTTIFYGIWFTLVMIVIFKSSKKKLIST